MTILVYSSNNAPGVIRFTNLEGQEDALLVSPGRTYKLSVSEVLFREAHVTYTVLDEGSSPAGGGLPIVRRKKTEEAPPSE